MEHNEMLVHRFPLDNTTADRLAAGELDPCDVPPGYAGAARVLIDARRAGAAGEIGEELLGSMVRVIEANPTNVRTPHMIAKLRSAKVGSIAAVVVLSTAGAAAAAAGNLPDPAQDAVSGVVAQVGLDLPDSGEDHPTGTADNPTEADSHGAEVSAVARSTATTGAEKGAAVSAAARAGHGPEADGEDVADETNGAVEQGKPTDPGSQAPVATPNTGGTGTASEASGGRSDTGTVNAPDQAAAGSSNSADHPTADDNPGSGRIPVGRP